LTPKYFIVRPSDLEALGLTVADVKKMIKEQNLEKLWEKNT
jgi:multidrug efflux pump subunit AcrB